MNREICEIQRTFQVTIFFPLLFFFINCEGQTQKSLSNEFRDSSSSEKIYLHCDRPYYLPGDTIWFKAYVFDRQIPSGRNTNLFLQSYDCRGKVLANIIAPILTWGAIGQVILPVDFHGDALLLKAYTSSMANADSKFISVKSIPVIHSGTSPVKEKSSPAIRFFPEGGELVCGLPCVIAFKISGNGDSLRKRGGVIRNTRKETVAEFSEGYDGMGVFSIIPRPHETYKAFWTDENGKEHEDILPSAKVDGVVLHVNDIKDGKKFFVFRTKSSTDRELFLVAKIGEQTVYQSKINLAEKIGLNGVIPTNNLPSGIMRIAICNKLMQPLAERICFINNEECRFNVGVAANVINKEKRGLNRLTIAIKEDLVSNLSVSITDADAISSSPDTGNLISSMLLPNEFQGAVYNPSRYFTGSLDSLKLRDLDLVMLTHDWQQSVSNLVLHEKRQVIADTKDRYITLYGKINDPKYASTPLSVFMKTDDQSQTISNITTDKEGRFIMKDLVFYGKASLFIKGEKDRNFLSRNQLVITSNLSKAYPFLDSAAITLNYPRSSSSDSTEAMRSKTESSKIDSITSQKNILLKEVDIQAKAKTQIQKLDKLHAAGLFAGTDFSRNIDLTNDKTAFVNASIFQYLQNKVPGLRVIGPLSIAPSAMWREENVMFFLNNQRAYTVDIQDLPVTEIEYIKVYEPSMGAAFGAVGGVVSIYTKKGINSNGRKKTGDNFIPVEGYSISKQFFLPDYSGSKTDPLPDKRITLYWNPELLFDKSKKTAEIKFYNNDVTKKFRLVLEGINSAGKLVHIEKIF